MAVSVNKTAHPFNKQQLESVLTQRFFYAPAFEIYGGEYVVCASKAMTLIDCTVQVWLACTIMAHPVQHCKPTS